MKFGSALSCCLVGVAALEKTCKDYFGDVSHLVTVVDPTVGVPGKTDGSGEYCDANNVSRPCTFIHYAGLKTECGNPAPPDAAHQYHKVTYSHHCRRVLEHMNLTWQVDVNHEFDSQGVLKRCAKYVISNDASCWAPPAENPERVSCDEQFATTTTTTAKTCKDYFGDVSHVVTVVDPTVGVPGKTDGSGEYCDANNVSRPCTFIHYAGLKTECGNPAPPDATHQYHKVTYSHHCRRVLEHMNLTWQVDVNHEFDSQGVLKRCSKYVISNDVSCWSPPAEDPQRVSCDAKLVAPPTTTTTTVVKTCEDYFGDVSGVVTVVDPTIGVPGKTDGSGEYCDANNVSRPCSFIHYAGLKTECRNPGPPDSTHRYHKVTYSDECRPVLEKMNLTWQVDVDRVFDSEGVLKQCSDYVLRIDASCWAPPAEDPQPAACDVMSTDVLVV